MLASVTGAKKLQAPKKEGADSSPSFALSSTNDNEAQEAPGSNVKVQKPHARDATMNSVHQMLRSGEILAELALLNKTLPPGAELGSAFYNLL